MKHHPFRAFTGRTFDTQEELTRYLAGFRSFPKWPKIGMNGSSADADLGCPEATGYYDAEREYEEKQDRYADLDEADRYED